MSRNSKNARRIQQARDMSKMRLGGGKGPSQTTPKHGKSHTYRTPATEKAIGAAVAAMESRINQRQRALLGVGA